MIVKKKTKVLLYFAGAVCLAVLISKMVSPPVYYINGFAQGGVYNIVLRTWQEKKTVGLAKEIADMLEEFENSVSLFREDSRISRINRNETDELDQYMIDCIEASQAASIASNGLFDITVKPLTAAFGFAEREAYSNPNIDSLLQFVGFRKISIVGNRLVKERPEVQIDLNASGQGYSADLMARILDRRKIRNYLVSIGGGELYARGTNSLGKPWRIGIDAPFENFIPGQSPTDTLHISNKGVATSGNYRKFRIDENGRRYVHTINPITGDASESNVLSATVIADDAITADIYGTVLMLLGLEDAKKFLESRDDLMGYLIYDSLGIYKTYFSPELVPKILKR